MNAMSESDLNQQRRAAAKRTALWVTLTALTVYGMFIYLAARGA